MSKQETITLPLSEYEAMIRRLETADDNAAIERAKAGKSDYLPAEMVSRLIDGESPMKIFRELRGMTQDELAKQADVKKSYISRIETGNRDGSVRVLVNCARAIKVDVDDLV